MLSFTSDYIAGAHPVIMQRLLETNMEKTRLTQGTGSSDAQ